MNKFYCDKCKREVKGNDSLIGITVNILKGDWISASYIDFGNHIELCKSCNRELKKWIKEK